MAEEVETGFYEGNTYYSEDASVNADGSGEADLYGSDGSHYEEAWDSTGHGEIEGHDGAGNSVDEYF